jgi:predicted oxidoreductase
VEAFKEKGADFVVAPDLHQLVEGMNRINPGPELRFDHIKAQIEARDGQVSNKVAKDAQVTAIRGARAYLGDKLIRTAKPHRILEPKAGPLIGVRLNVLTRKSLGGIHTDLQGRVLRSDGQVFPGLYAAGEVAGFGGGGYHGYNALEGTFLGGCIFSGKVVGEAL